MELRINYRSGYFLLLRLKIGKEIVPIAIIIMIILKIATVPKLGALIVFLEKCMFKELISEEFKVIYTIRERNIKKRNIIRDVPGMIGNRKSHPGRYTQY